MCNLSYGIQENAIQDLMVKALQEKSLSLETAIKVFDKDRDTILEIFLNLTGKPYCEE